MAVRPLQMVGGNSRRRLLTTFINLARWLRTINVLQLLPPGPPVRIGELLQRPSPYGSRFRVYQLVYGSDNSVRHYASHFALCAHLKACLGQRSIHLCVCGVAACSLQ